MSQIDLELLVKGILRYNGENNNVKVDFFSRGLEKLDIEELSKLVDQYKQLILKTIFFNSFGLLSILIILSLILIVSMLLLKGINGLFLSQENGF